MSVAPPPVVPEVGSEPGSEPGTEPTVNGHSFPPVGVYLLEGGCGMQDGINIICYFMFVSPGTPLASQVMVAYVHGFGLLAYKKLWPKMKPHFEEMKEKLKEIINPPGVADEITGAVKKAIPALA